MNLFRMHNYSTPETSVGVSPKETSIGSGYSVDTSTSEKSTSELADVVKKLNKTADAVEDTRDKLKDTNQIVFFGLLVVALFFVSLVFSYIYFLYEQAIKNDDTRSLQSEMSALRRRLDEVSVSSSYNGKNLEKINTQLIEQDEIFKCLKYKQYFSKSCLNQKNN